MSDSTEHTIKNQDLTEAHIPDPRADWRTIIPFALSFDGYRRWGSFERCAKIGNRWRDRYRATAALPKGLDNLRTCLFFEQRRWRHFDEEPDEATRQYISAFLGEITEAVGERTNRRSTSRERRTIQVQHTLPESLLPRPDRSSAPSRPRPTRRNPAPSIADTGLTLPTRKGGAPVWCTRCKAIQRKPDGGRRCPLCNRSVLSTEQLNEPNHLLYLHWRAVFRRIPGFERCVCLRRVRCPDRAMDMDFLLLQPPPRPTLGLVEVEGWNVRKDVAMQAWKGVDQLSRYLKAFRRYCGDGETIMHESIDDAFEPGKQRGQTNLRTWRNRERWMRTLPGVRDEPDLVRLLTSTSRRLVLVLLCFRKPSPDGSALPLTEARSLARALPQCRAYVGTIAWPSANKLLHGQYLPG